MGRSVACGDVQCGIATAFPTLGPPCSMYKLLKYVFYLSLVSTQLLNSLLGCPEDLLEVPVCRGRNLFRRRSGTCKGSPFLMVPADMVYWGSFLSRVALYLLNVSICLTYWNK